MINIKRYVTLAIKEVDCMLNDEIELKKGLNEDVVKEISKIKDEPEWMRNFRLKSYETFKNMPMPNFGPNLDIDFNNHLIIGKVLDVMLKILLIVLV